MALAYTAQSAALKSPRINACESKSPQVLYSSYLCKTGGPNALVFPGFSTRYPPLTPDLVNSFNSFRPIAFQYAQAQDLLR